MDKFFKEDLDYFLAKAVAKKGEIDPDYPDEANHINFYFLHSRRELDDWIADYKDKHRVTNAYDFCYFMNALLKYMMGAFDSHTSFNLPYYGFRVCRIVHIEGDGYYIDGASESDIAKAKILAINGVDIKQIEHELTDCIASGSDGELTSRIVWYLQTPMIMRTLPSINASSETIEYMTDKGVIKIYIGKQPRIKPNARFDHPNVFADGDIVVGRYQRCQNNFVPDIEKVDELIKPSKASGFILDLRGNKGGNSEALLPLVDYLKASDLKIVTLIDAEVYSSAIFAVQDMRRIGSKVVGQACAPSNSFGNIVYTYTTPNTLSRFNFTNAFWLDRDRTKGGIHTKKELELAARDDPSFWTPHNIPLDKHIAMSRDEYLYSDDDVVLNKCIDYAKSL